MWEFAMLRAYETFLNEPLSERLGSEQMNEFLAHMAKRYGELAGTREIYRAQAQRTRLR